MSDAFNIFRPQPSSVLLLRSVVQFNRKKVLCYVKASNRHPPATKNNPTPVCPSAPLIHPAEGEILHYLSVSLRNTPILEICHQPWQAVAAVPLVVQGIEHHQPGSIELSHLGVLQEAPHILQQDTKWD